jgi:hypothetical protein
MKRFMRKVGVRSVLNRKKLSAKAVKKEEEGKTLLIKVEIEDFFAASHIEYLRVPFTKKRKMRGRQSSRKIELRANFPPLHHPIKDFFVFLYSSRPFDEIP